MKHLAAVFAIDVCAYAVMSNHFHVVLKVDVERLSFWSDDEVLQRWRQLYRGDILVNRYISGRSLTRVELATVQETITDWRDRLQDISWFMRCLSESIARQANSEDGVKGHFWAGRFKSQALLDEQAVLSCMMFVDLNPIRAGLAKTAKTSKNTSIYERIQAMSVPADGTKKRGRPAKNSSTERANKNNNQKSEAVGSTSVEMAPLCRFLDQVDSCDHNRAIPFAYSDYLALLNWTGRTIRSNKFCSIPAQIQAILNRLDIANGNHWVNSVCQFNNRYACYAGSTDRLRQVSQQMGLRWVKGQAD